MSVHSGLNGRGASAGGFNRLWTAAAISNLGDGMLLSAVPLLTVSLTTDPLLVAGATAASQLPWLLFALPSGALVDRWDRRQVMLAADGLRAVAALLLAAAAFAAGAPLGIVAVYALAFVLAAAETLFDPASEAMVAALVPPDGLARANSRLQATSWLTNIFAGPALGAVLFGLGAGLPFLVDGLSFIVAVAIVATLRGPFRARGGHDGPRSGATGDAGVAAASRRRALGSEIGEGLRWLVAHKLLRSLAVSAGIINLASFGVIATFVLYAGEVLGVSGTAYGVLLSAFGVGGLVGATLAPRAIRAVGPGAAIRIGLLLGAGAALVMSATTSLVIVVVASLGFGIMLTFWNVVMITLRQRLVPDRLRGRVMSAYRLVSWGTQPLGAVLGGLIANLVSLQAVLANAAIVYVAVAAISMAILRGRSMPGGPDPVPDAPHPTAGR